MKTKSLIIVAAMTGLIAGAQAEEGKKKRPHRTLPPEIIAKFDKDGDGKLDEAERKEARAARGEKMAERRKEMLEKFDTDKDGELSDTERKAMREEMKKRMIEKFDKDGDGELNEEERAEARKAMKDRRDGPRRPHGKKGDRKRPEKGGNGEAPGVLGN